jgi:hypothetical protein
MNETEIAWHAGIEEPLFNRGKYCLWHPVASSRATYQNCVGILGQTGGVGSADDFHGLSGLETQTDHYKR